MPDDATFLAEYEALATVERVRRASPAIFYEPHQNGQFQFHLAPHKIRCLWPGNRFGKTTAMGIEADHYMMHRVRPGWARVKPHPQEIMWFCPQYRQFEILRKQLERECFTTGWTWNEKYHRYIYPRGDMLYVVSSDITWEHVQGVNPDLICVDEECPAPLWREARARGYGAKDTRYVIAATATQGLTWMYEDLYLPWLRHHQDQGLSEMEAIEAQTHGEIWAWPMGGIEDNPSINPDKAASFRDIRWSSEKERQVRIRGGFASLAGDCIFDPDGLERLRELCREYADDPDPIFSRGSLKIAHPHPLPKVWI